MLLSRLVLNIPKAAQEARPIFWRFWWMDCWWKSLTQLCSFFLPVNCSIFGTECFYELVLFHIMLTLGMAHRVKYLSDHIDFICKSLLTRTLLFLMNWEGGLYFSHILHKIVPLSYIVTWMYCSSSSLLSITCKCYPEHDENEVYADEKFKCGVLLLWSRDPKKFTTSEPPFYRYILTVVSHIRWP